MAICNEHPHLVVEQALLEAPEINIQVPAVGDPQGRTGIPSGGIGFKGGIGDGRDSGVGNDRGPYLGG